MVVDYANITSTPTIAWTIKEGNGNETTTVSNGETFTIEDGTGIQSELTSASDGGTITITNTAPMTGDSFDEDGTYASLRAQGTTADDVGLGSVEDTALSTYTGESGALDNQYITNGAGYTTNTGDITEVRLVGDDDSYARDTSGAAIITISGTGGITTSGTGTTFTIDGSSVSVDYGDVTNTPNIPTNVSDLVNDSGFTANSGDITAVQLSADSGSATDSSGTANITVTGSGGITTSGSGSTITIDGSGIAGGGGVLANVIVMNEDTTCLLYTSDAADDMRV